MARRKGFWIPFSLNDTVTASTTTMDSVDALAFISDLGITTRRDMTIARIRGYCTIINDGLDTSQVDVSTALMVSHEGEDLAITTLLTAKVTSPIWRLDTVSSGQNRETAAASFSSIPDIYPVDTKAMRKLDRSNNELHLVSTVGAGANVIIRVRGVIYLLEP